MALTPIQRSVLIPMWAAERVRLHSPRTGPHGESCDEMGCGVCNLGDDYVDAVVEASRMALNDPHDVWSSFPWPDDDELVEAAQEWMAELVAG